MAADSLAALVSLGCGAAGALVGLFIGFAPEPHLASLRRAQKSKTTELREGDFVCLEGTLRAPQPLEGAVSRAAVAVQRLEYTAPNRPNRARGERGTDVQHGELRSAEGLALDDGEGRVFLDLEGGMLLTTRRFTGTERNLGDLHWRKVAMKDTVEIFEASIAVGAKVLALGEATFENRAWRLRGRDVFLTDVSRAELEKSDARSRTLGLAVAGVSVGVGVLAAIAFAI
jgi:hypothetical protein